MKRAMRKVCFTAVTAVLVAATTSAMASVLWTDVMTSTYGGPDARWTSSVDMRSTGSTGIVATTTGLQFKNGMRDYANLRTSVDGSKVTSVVGSSYTWNGVYWLNVGVAVYWDANNWVRFYPNVSSSSSSTDNWFEVEATINGVYSEVTQYVDGLNPRQNATWSLKMEFTDTQVKFYWDDGLVADEAYDGVIGVASWNALNTLTLARADSLKGEDAYLIYGKAYKGANSYLCNDYDVTTPTTLSSNTFGYFVQYSEVPEPVTTGLLCLGCAGMMIFKKKKQ